MTESALALRDRWIADIEATQASHREMLEGFHRLFYRAEYTWRLTTWRGRLMWKAPTDVLVYQQIVWDYRPDLILETGTADGGTSLFFADLLDLAQVDGGEVVTIEVAPDNHRPVPEHPRLTQIVGSSVDPAIVSEMHRRAATKQRVMVVLDSNHHPGHVAYELTAYAPLVRMGGWLIVEDTNHQIIQRDYVGENCGPADVLPWFLDGHPEFIADRLAERYLLTFNPGGYLRRVA